MKTLNSKNNEPFFTLRNVEEVEEEELLGIVGGNGDVVVYHKGKEITITGDFVANQDTKVAVIEIDASVGGITIPVPK